MLANIKPKRSERNLSSALSQLSNDGSDEYCPQVELPMDSPDASDSEFLENINLPQHSINQKKETPKIDKLEELHVADGLEDEDIIRFKNAKLISLAKKVCINLIITTRAGD